MEAIARRAWHAVAAKREVSAAQLSVLEMPPAGGDADLLYHVWHNLLDNACKFAGQRDKPRIEIGGSRGQGESSWYVRDNGVGFDMRYAPKLFDMFQRLHAEGEFPGVGTGLAMVRRIVARHGGRARADAAPQEYACFQFSLPDQPVS